MQERSLISEPIIYDECMRIISEIDDIKDISLKITELKDSIPDTLYLSIEIMGQPNIIYMRLTQHERSLSLNDFEGRYLRPALWVLFEGKYKFDRRGNQ